MINEKRLDKRRLYKDHEIYVNEAPAQLSSDDNFHLTVNIDIFWERSSAGKCVGLAASLKFLDLHWLFRESKFSKMVIHTNQTRACEVLMLLQKHESYIEKICISDVKTDAVISAERWITSDKKAETLEGRLPRVRERTVLLLEKIEEEGAPTVDVSTLLMRYATTFGETLIKDVLLKALAIRHINVAQIYVPYPRGADINVTRALKQVGILQCRPRAKRDTMEVEGE